MITGGARSGKSTLAEDKARTYERVTYIATARAFDEEMIDRIKKHREGRPDSWTTFEGVTGLGEAVEESCQCVLLDCVTNLIANLMMDMAVDWERPQAVHVKEAEVLAINELDALIARVRALGTALILVNNEVGLGLVPAYPFGRAFRDVAGRVGQWLARKSDEVILVVSGIPVQIK